MKIRALIFGAILCTLVIANPVHIYTHLSELQIIEPYNWKIEIFDRPRELKLTDSLIVESLSGHSKVIRRGVLADVVIDQDCLADTLTMSREHDYIRLYYYFKDGTERVDEIKIGTYPGSYIHNLRSDQSVCRWLNYDVYFKNNTPSFGEMNSLDDQIMGLLTGIVERADGNRLKEKTIYFSMDPQCCRYTKTNRNGNYSIGMEARYYEINSLEIGETGETINYRTVSFDLEPGDTLKVDFHSLQSSITPVIQNTIRFNNYPHPASTYTWLFIDNAEVEASAMRVNVYALNGRKVDSFIPSAKQFRYDCSHLPQGSYVLSLQKGSEVLATKKLQIMK